MLTSSTCQAKAAMLKTLQTFAEESDSSPVSLDASFEFQYRRLVYVIAVDYYETLLSGPAVRLCCEDTNHLMHGNFERIHCLIASYSINCFASKPPS